MRTLGSDHARCVSFRQRMSALLLAFPDTSFLLLSAILIDQFGRLRDGDRFWYERTLTKEEIAWVKGRGLADIIRDNTQIATVARGLNVFLAQGGGSNTLQPQVALPTRRQPATTKRQERTRRHARSQGKGGRRGVRQQRAPQKKKSKQRVRRPSQRRGRHQNRRR